jgi:hypothetical protein
MNNPLLEEIYSIRERIWKECGETTEGLVQYLRTSPVEGFQRSDLKPVKPRPSRLQPEKITTLDRGECVEDHSKSPASFVAEGPLPSYQA